MKCLLAIYYFIMYSIKKVVMSLIMFFEQDKNILNE